MRQFIAVLSALLLFNAFLAAQNIPVAADYDRLLLGVEQLLNRGEYKAILAITPEPIRSLSGRPSLTDRLAQLLTAQGTAFRHLARLQESLSTHQKACDLREWHCGANSPEFVNSLLNLGNVYWEMDSVGVAREQFLRAEAISSTQTEVHPGDLAAIYNSLGHVYLRNADLTRAGSYFLKAFEIVQNEWSDAPARLTPFALSLAYFYREAGRFEEAFILLEDLLRLHQERKTRHYVQLADLHRELAPLYTHRQDFSAALLHCDSALWYYEQLDSISARNYGNCLQNKGVVLMSIGDLTLAQAHFDLAVNYLQPFLSDLGIALQNFGLTYLYQGNFSMAKQYFSEAAATYLAGQVNLQSREMAAVNHHLGTYFLEKYPSEPASAEFYFQEAAGIYKSLGLNSLWLKSLNKLGLSYSHQEQYAKALTVLKQTERLALPQFPLIGASSLYYQAELKIEQHQLEQARPLLRAALELTQKNTLHFQIRILASLATVEQKDEQWEKCLEYASLGISLLGTLKSQLVDPESEIMLKQEFFQLYDLALEACFSLQEINANYAALAFELSEQFKGQSLDRHLNTSVDSPLENTITKLERQLAALGIQKFLLSEQSVDTNKITSLNQQQLKLERNLANYRQQRSVKYSNSFSPEEAQNQLAEGQTLLTYHWGEQYLFAFLLTQQDFSFQQITLVDSIHSTVQRLFNRCRNRVEQEPPRLQEQIYLELVTDAQFLYHQLIGPFERELGESLLIVPDGPLALLPFDLLIRKAAPEYRSFRKHHYLLEDHHISYLYPAAELLNWPKKQNPPGRVLAVAPTFDSTLTDLPPLIYNVPEVDQLLNVAKGKMLVGSMATKEQFLKLAANYAVIHLATHGILDHQNPGFSYVAFRQDKDGPATGKLFVRQIESLSLPADMVVLSACQSALGQLYRGEGLLSMARAFRLAGAHSLVASLWNVDDRQTPEIMTTFYGLLAQGYSRSDALRTAKIQYIKSSSNFEAFPFFWAGFLLHGDHRPIALSTPWRFWKLWSD